MVGVDKAYVESLATGTIEVLDTRSQTGYLAAREAARRDGAPLRIMWHHGKGVNQARVDAGEAGPRLVRLGRQEVHVFVCDHM